MLFYCFLMFHFAFSPQLQFSFLSASSATALLYFTFDQIVKTWLEVMRNATHRERLMVKYLVLYIEKRIISVKVLFTVVKLVISKSTQETKRIATQLISSKYRDDISGDGDSVNDDDSGYDDNDDGRDVVLMITFMIEMIKMITYVTALGEGVSEGFVLDEMGIEDQERKSLYYSGYGDDGCSDVDIYDRDGDDDNMRLLERDLFGTRMGIQFSEL